LKFVFNFEIMSTTGKAVVSLFDKYRKDKLTDKEKVECLTMAFSEYVLDFKGGKADEYDKEDYEAMNDIMFVIDILRKS